MRSCVIGHRFAPLKSTLALASALSFGAGCEDPCSSSEEPTLELGRLQGANTFEPLETGDEVTLGFAPQGGQGVFTAIRTIGLEAHPNFGLFAKQVSMSVRLVGTDAAGERDVFGDFPVGGSIRCVDGENGVVPEAIFGLDPERFGFGSDPSNPDDPITALDGQSVTLEVDVFDENSRGGTVSADVVLRTVQ
jgi:hypothetical protein